MNTRFLGAACVTWVALALVWPCSAAPNEKVVPDAGHSVVVPQLLVVCTGWHALCSATTDCQLNGDGADCDCWKVNENHIVETSEIQDVAIKHLTEARCTNKRPCDVDEAPVCKAIQDGRYEVESVKYQWVSTFSYRGWCDFYRPKACDTTADGYTGDFYWAICDVAPCTEAANPVDPDRPLTCQCRVLDGPFVGSKDSCYGDNGGIISAMPLWVWDFENNTWRIPVPGYEYIGGACGPIHSDLPPPP